MQYGLKGTTLHLPYSIEAEAIFVLLQYAFLCTFSNFGCHSQHPYKYINLNFYQCILAVWWLFYIRWIKPCHICVTAIKSLPLLFMSFFCVGSILVRLCAIPSPVPLVWNSPLMPFQIGGFCYGHKKPHNQNYFQNLFLRRFTYFLNTLGKDR